MKAGDWVQLPTGPGRSLTVRVIRGNADAIDWRRCSRCGQPFGYGPIGESFPARELVCPFDCT